MMGSRGTKGGNECDALSHRTRRHIHSRKLIRYCKRKFWKRTRRTAKQETRAHG